MACLFEEDLMGPIGHFAVGLATKPVAPKVPLAVLFLATVILDILAIAFAFVGIESVKTGIPWSHCACPLG